MPNPTDIINGLTEDLAKNPVVKAFILVGSQARDDVYRATAHSDMEAYIIAADESAEEVEQGLPDLVAKYGSILFSFKHAIGFVAVYDDLFRLELPVIKQSEMKGLFSRPKAQVVKVLFDRTEGELEKVLAQRPETIDYPELFTDKVTNFWYWQILAVQYFKKGEIYNTRAVLGIHASALIKLFELINDPKLLLLETNKRVEQFLTEDQLEILRQITPAYNAEPVKQSLEVVMDIFPKVFEEVKEKYGYDYDETLEEKVKPRLYELIEEK